MKTTADAKKKAYIIAMRALAQCRVACDKAGEASALSTIRKLGYVQN